MFGQYLLQLNLIPIFHLPHGAHVGDFFAVAIHDFGVVFDQHFFLLGELLFDGGDAIGAEFGDADEAGAALEMILH